MKKLAIALTGVLALLLIAVVVVPNVIPWKMFEPRIAAAVREATGRELRIDGDLDVSILSDLGFRAEGVRLSNVPGASEPDMLALKSVTGKVRLVPLLGGRVIVDELVVREPVFHLEVAADGQPNWVFEEAGGDRTGATQPAEAEDGEPSSGLPVRDLNLADVRLENGVAAYHDARTGQTLDAREINLALALPELARPLSLTGRLTLNGEPVTLAFSADSPAALLAGERTVLKADVTSAPVRVRYDGAAQQRPVMGLDGNFGVDVPSVGRLLAWLDRPLADGQPDPGPLRVEAVLTAAGPKVGLERATIEGKVLQLQAAGGFDTSQAVPRFDADIKVLSADLDAYLPPPTAEPQAAGDGGAGAGPAPTGEEPAGWSEEPIDLSALRQAEGDARVEIGDVRYRGLAVRRGVVTVTLAGGVLKTAVEGVRLAQGTIGATATVDASGPVPALAYRATVSGVQARPLLRALADTDRLSGAAEFEARGEARGRSQREFVETLAGDGRFKFLNGAIHGINIAATLRQARTLGFDAAAREAQKTDFAELGGSFVITNGVLENRDLSMLAPLLRLTGEGRVPLPARTIDYQLVANLVPTLKGQGGSDALAGLPIPIGIKGSWDEPIYGVEWKSVFQEMAKDPQRLVNLPQDLRQVGQNLGVNLRVPDLPAGAGDEVGRLLEAIPGIVGGGGAATGDGATGAGAAGAAVDSLLKQFTEPKKKRQQPAALAPSQLDQAGQRQQQRPAEARAKPPQAPRAPQPQAPQAAGVQPKPQAAQPVGTTRPKPQAEKPAVEDVVRGLTKGLFGN